jgi:AcrR family transcriptional regulator
VSEDPRVLRTRRRLKSTLLELIDEVGYEAITIDLLTDRADVARSTFYAHYSAKEDLLFAGFDAWLLSFAELAPPVEGEPGRFRFSLPLLRHGATQRKFFKETVLRGPSHRVRRRLNGIVSAVALRELVATGAESDGDPAAVGRAKAVASAFLGLFEWWLDEARNLPAEEVDGIFQRTVGIGAD